ncbi:beta strand repeat-containing protein [Usitatibacter palustris]|uniref:Uncharacterized protein n=1 Tax=Usitatibacter palustris TaxID=2732487 RepID=A0A6M4H5T8_9PROT|nr:hypothetical protein [Usitatibacter palustris]QJR14860.1 hypothetical protein DSM104440_01675 [Usitatibacter palustris]
MNTNTTAKREAPSRSAVVAMFVLVAGLLFGLSTGRAHAAPPAGTVIGNQATATYVDAGLTSRSTTSNLVQTTVSQVKSFTLDSPGFRAASAGQTVYYPHTITNTGNGTDTYTLNTPVATGGAFTHATPVYYIDADGNGVPDNFTPITTTGPIAMAGVFRFVLAGTVPGGATNGQVGTMTASVSDTTPTTLTNLDTTTVANAAIAVTKSLSVTSGPSPGAAAITVTLQYTNSGSAAASNFELRDVVNPLNGFTYVPGSGRWSGTGATALTDGAGGDTGIAYDFNVTAANRVTATIASVPATSSGQLTFQVTVNSGVAPGLIPNTASYLYDAFAATNTNTATYQVLRIANVVANGSTTVSTNGTAEPVTIASAAPGSTLNFTNVIWNHGNAADQFVISMTGNAAPPWPLGTTFTLLQADGITSLIANTTPSIPVFAAGCPVGFEADATNLRCGYRVILRVQLPAVASGGPFSVVKTATSVFDNTRTDTVTDTLTVIGTNTVDLTNNTARSDSTPAGTATTGNNGHGVTGATVITTNLVTPSPTGPTTSRFVLYVNNTSGVADSYNLTTTGTPAGWSVTFRADGGVLPVCSTVGAALASTGTIGGGTNRLVCAEVVVPATTSNQAAAGNYDLTFTATSALNGTVLDSKVDRVTVNAVNSVTVTPNNTQQTFPGGSVTYAHTITNLGNTSETISFVAGFLSDSRSGQGWTSAAYLDAGVIGVFEPGIDDVPANLISTATTFALGVNATRTVWIRVFAPGSAVALDPANVTTFTARYNAGASGASATDSTSVTDGLVLVKEQVAVGCAAPGPHVGYTTAPIPSGPATAPGMCIAYRITGTNTTAAGITSVVISDNIPANTRQHNACGAPATAPGTITSPGNGNLGTIAATVGPLTPSSSAVVTFCVRIDP